MKREILCTACALEARELFPTDDPYPGEHVRFVEGIAVKTYVCDHHGGAIAAGESATAFTIWTDAQGFHDWEGSFLREPVHRPAPAAGGPQ